MTRFQRLELEEELLALQLTLKRCEKAKVQNEEDLQRILVNEEATQKAIVERRERLAAADKE